MLPLGIIFSAFIGLSGVAAAFAGASLGKRRTHVILDENLGVPVIGFEKEKLAAGLQKPIKNRKILRELIMAENGGADHVVETFGGQVILEAGYFCKFDVWDCWRRLRKLVVENSGGDRTFTPQYGGKVFSPQAASGPEFEDRLTGQNME